MSSCIIREAEVSGSAESDVEIIDEITRKEDQEFIDDSVNNEDIDFYHQVDFNDEPEVKKGVGRLRIESESCDEESSQEDDLEYEIPNSEPMDFPEDNMVILPEAIIDVYGTDDYEWNHHELPTGEIYEFPNAKLFIKRFLKSLHMSVEDNTSVKDL